MFKNKTALLFIFTAFISGLCGSFFYPLSSLFIIEALNASPAMLSAYMVLTVCSSVVVSQFIAVQSDKNWQRKHILITALCCYFITVVGFSVIRNYYVAVGFAMVFGSISGAIFGQLFALGREYADKHLTDSTTFLGTMRAGIAIAWVFGPPLAFLLKSAFGFSASFLAASVATAITIVITVFFIPSIQKEAKTSTTEESQGASHPNAAGHQKTKRKLNSRIVIFSVAIVFMFSASNLYINVMPLYLSKELLIGTQWVGILFGLAAFCEIPIMMNAGKMAHRFGTLRVLSVGLICGSLFYIGMLNLRELNGFMALQILNGVFIGLTATLGMVAMQDMMKDRLGTASTLFTSLMQVSTLISSLAIGIVGELFSYYGAFYVSLSSVTLSLFILNYLIITERRTMTDAVSHAAG
ncbi:sugar efflux transporter [Photobacterium aphoticum]|uniref:MFS transporter n=1 Tax=Photobacterium aphoticum TaxID=754436 RepID=A0A0J1GQH4_9GAMM|nr:sugar efflux transporter [Photobacterium aphoticum]KLV02025.1 MFS transporter [Photobacterium aphoticum]PSU60270.1 MFS transporter [Photobacterium aphoticum]GHA34508.1 MFS transporter [Photobacterium aphoticum]